MSTLIDDRDDAIPAKLETVPIEGMFRCKRCSLSYAPNRSTSALKLTYCSFLCELGDLGFSMDGLEKMEPPRKIDPNATPDPEPEPAGAAPD